MAEPANFALQTQNLHLGVVHAMVDGPGLRRGFVNPYLDARDATSSIPVAPCF